MTIGMRGARALRSVLVGCALIAAPSVARADRHYPLYLHTQLPMPCIPQCTICHDDNNGGLRTLRAITLNGASAPGMGAQWQAQFGLYGVADDSSIGPALGGARASMFDTDKDGIADVVELQAGTDPNDLSPNTSICLDAPEYGCGRVARAAPRNERANVIGVAVLLGAVAAFRRRQSKTRAR